uniref:Uncharacterized protein n=1 Tax=Aegilops tauschii subsp. strangulata TaxID=200361 RepID=A0A453G1Y0_AEGTS
ACCWNSPLSPLLAIDSASSPWRGNLNLRRQLRWPKVMEMGVLDITAKLSLKNDK